MTDASEETWYIVKQISSQCSIVTAAELEALSQTETAAALEKWGPFKAKNQAIAKRIGLIRSGKCQPVT